MDEVHVNLIGNIILTTIDGVEHSLRRFVSIWFVRINMDRMESGCKLVQIGF